MPDDSLLVLIVIIVLAVGFGVVNGFTDAANAIAAAVGSRALSPRNALLIAIVANLIGAATGLEVAKTIGKGILVPEAITYLTVIAALGSVIVWGSGASRRIPGGWDRGKAEEQYVAALRLAGPIAAAQGLTLALEPLPTRETNIANTTVEAMGYIRKAEADGISLMVDLRHFTTMNEPLENLDACKDLLVHSHVGDPLSNPDRLKQQLGRLKANGFSARMSFEGGVRDLKNGLKPAVEALRKMWAEA